MQQTYSVIYFWLEVVLQFVIGIAGFIANLAVVPILCRSGFVQRHTSCHSFKTWRHVTPGRLGNP